jgi:hypothetical protein
MEQNIHWLSWKEKVKFIQNCKLINRKINIFIKYYHFPSIFHLIFPADSRPIPVRMFTFVPGQTLGEWMESNKCHRFSQPFIDKLAENIGHYLGQFHFILDRFEFCPPIFREYSPLISLECWPKLREEFELQKKEFGGGLLDEKKAKMCEIIFDEFEREVLSKREKFAQGELSLLAFFGEIIKFRINSQ